MEKDGALTKRGTGTIIKKNLLRRKSFSSQQIFSNWCVNKGIFIGFLDKNQRFS